MTIAIIVFSIFGGLILLGGGFFLFAWLFGKKKFPFILYSKDGISTTIMNGTVVRDSKNKAVKKFAFSETDTKLDIAPPTLFIGRKGYREVTFDDLNELVYIKGHKLDDEQYKKKALLPEEKQIALYRYKENVDRYRNPLDKINAGIILGGFVLILLLLIGIVYCTVTYANLTGSWLNIMENQEKVAKQYKSTADTQLKAIELQTSVIAAITKEMNITRQIS